ncbi:MAG: BMP family ABC transporter substrate-binding protein [Lachnospiraceae bacterium]|nr:BMP family ABC transporter substrate-binding protein [Lachnospiraceae bacterium]
MSKTKVRFFAAVLCAFFLTGCGKASDEIELVRVWERDDKAADETGGDAAAEGLSDAWKIGIVTDDTEDAALSDDSFKQSAKDGLSNLEAAYGIQTAVANTGSEQKFSEGFKKLISEGCNLCWGIGYNSADALLESAKTEPDKNFAIIDFGFEEAPENVTGVMFRAQEPSFLVGYIAGSVTGSGKVGFIGGERSATIDQFQYGFEAGVQYAAKTYSKQTEVLVEYADSFSDDEKAEGLADAMYAEGCDIIYHAAGGAGLGVIRSAEKNGKFVIGVDKDQSYLAPANVLTSALKKVDVAIERVSLSFVRQEPIGGKTLSFGLTEGAVGIPTEHENFRDEVYDATLLIEDKIKSGAIVPPDSKEAYDIFLDDLNQEQ